MDNICPKCKKENQDKADFCQECGSKLNDTKTFGNMIKSGKNPIYIGIIIIAAIVLYFLISTFLFPSEKLIYEYNFNSTPKDLYDSTNLQINLPEGTNKVRIEYDLKPGNYKTNFGSENGNLYAIIVQDSVPDFKTMIAFTQRESMVKRTDSMEDEFNYIPFYDHANSSFILVNKEKGNILAIYGWDIIGNIKVYAIS